MCADSGQAAVSCPGHRYAVLPGGGVEDGETAEAAALRELCEDTTLTARIDRLLWTGRHNGRPASYFLVADARGMPVLSGQEALDHGPANSFELRWAAPDDFDDLNLHPPGIRRQLTRLLDSLSPPGLRPGPDPPGRKVPRRLVASSTQVSELSAASLLRQPTPRPGPAGPGLPET